MLLVQSNLWVKVLKEKCRDVEGLVREGVFEKPFLWCGKYEVVGGGTAARNLISFHTIYGMLASQKEKRKGTILAYGFLERVLIDRVGSSLCSWPAYDKINVFNAERIGDEMDEQNMSSPNRLVQCRICHDEDEDSNMDTPCSCCGTLKYAHQKCVQRWCNEKGDTTCEICQQQLKPSYTAPPPPPLFSYGGSPINFGGNREISRRDLHNHQFLAMFTANHEFLDLDFEYSAPSTRSLMCCRIVAIIFLALLVLRHTLPIIFILNGAGGEYSMTVFMFIVFRIIGITVPMYIMIKATIAIQRLQYQDHHSPWQSHEENGMGQSQLRVIHILQTTNNTYKTASYDKDQGRTMLEFSHNKLLVDRIAFELKTTKTEV
ncbi:hypothetical protein VNO77_21627 [Canavalia gladiata]|uniref:RING-CH-type domain-containing protein n=1 Tax=Canavalia gladiata TaxID=3824 RepID=A0AAN9QKG7_CANGL